MCGEADDRARRQPDAGAGCASGELSGEPDSNAIAEEETLRRRLAGEQTGSYRRCEARFFSNHNWVSFCLGRAARNRRFNTPGLVKDQ
jgi:hypothetical protein